MNARSYRRTIASYLPPQGFAPRARVALEGLGYQVVAVATRGHFDDASWRPDLRLVGERHLGRLPPAPDDVPIVCVSDGRPLEANDARVVGFAARPVELASLYPLLQEALETHPRYAPRAPARITARCALADRRWTAELRALSEKGALLDSHADLAPGTELNLLFPLPLGRTISTRARVVTQGPAGTAVTFSGHAPPARTAIADYVERRLLRGRS